MMRWTSGEWRVYMADATTSLLPRALHHVNSLFSQRLPLLLAMSDLHHGRLSWRSHPCFVVLTIATGQFSDIFMFGMRVPLLPYLVRSHLGVPEDEVQSRVASLLASFSIATLVTAVPAGWLADFPAARSRLYLAGLGVLLWATVTFYTSGSYAVMVLSRMLNGVSAALLYAVGFAMVADAVGPGDLGKALGTVSLHPEPLLWQGFSRYTSQV